MWRRSYLTLICLLLICHTLVISRNHFGGPSLKLKVFNGSFVTTLSLLHYRTWMYSHQSFGFPKGGFPAIFMLPFYVCEVSTMYRKCYMCSLWCGDCCTLCNTPEISINNQKFVTVTLLLCGIMFFWQCIELEIQTCKQMLRVILSQEPERILSCAEQALTSLFNCIRHQLKKYFFVSVEMIYISLSFVN